MKRNLVLGLVTVLLVLGSAALQPVSAQNSFQIDVEADLGTFDQVESPGCPTCGPFYVGGILKDPDTNEEIGFFHCWGWIFGGGLGPVTQEYDITGVGKIIVSGIEDEGPRAVVGGTGAFSNVRGEASFDELFADFPDFTATFSLTGAGRGRGN